MCRDAREHVKCRVGLVAHHDHMARRVRQGLQGSGQRQPKRDGSVRNGVWGSVGSGDPHSVGLADYHEVRMQRRDSRQRVLDPGRACRIQALQVRIELPDLDRAARRLRVAHELPALLQRKLLNCRPPLSGVAVPEQDDCVSAGDLAVGAGW